jgi:hypothetical protein
MNHLDLLAVTQIKSRLRKKILQGSDGQQNVKTSYSIAVKLKIKLTAKKQGKTSPFIHITTHCTSRIVSSAYASLR